MMLGYGKPPKEHQFKKGQSGNSRGSEKGTLSKKAIVKAVANEMHRVAVDGLPPNLSTLELVLLTLRNAAMKGNIVACRAVEKLHDRYGPSEVDDKHGVLVVPAPLSQEEWIEKAMEHNAKLPNEPPGAALARSINENTLKNQSTRAGQNEPGVSSYDLQRQRAEASLSTGQLQQRKRYSEPYR